MLCVVYDDSTDSASGEGRSPAQNMREADVVCAAGAEVALARLTPVR